MRRHIRRLQPQVARAAGDGRRVGLDQDLAALYLLSEPAAHELEALDAMASSGRGDEEEDEA